MTRHDVGCMIGVMLVRTLGWMVSRGLVGVIGLGPSPDAKDVEIVVLRHQLAVLGRQVKRPRYTPSDHLVLAWSARRLPRERWSVFLVTPATLLRVAPGTGGRPLEVSVSR